jgi:hypothetical protein
MKPMLLSFTLQGEVAERLRPLEALHNQPHGELHEDDLMICSS